MKKEEFRLSDLSRAMQVFNALGFRVQIGFKPKEMDEVKKLNKQKASEVVGKAAAEMKADHAAGALHAQYAEKSGWAVNHEATAPPTDTDATYALFAGVRFRKASDKADLIKRVQWYVEEAKKQAIQAVIEDVNFQRDRLERSGRDKDSQIERLERAIRQISDNRASEVINACRYPYGPAEMLAKDGGGLTGRRN